MPPLAVQTWSAVNTVDVVESDPVSIVRALRSAPAFGVADPARGGAPSRPDAAKALRSLTSRGGCASLLATKFDDLSPGVRAVLLVSAPWPVPALARRFEEPLNAVAGARGTAGWHQREHSHTRAPRCAVAATGGRHPVSGPDLDPEKLPPAMLLALANDPQPATRAFVSTVRDLDIAVLEVLAQDPHFVVRAAAAAHPATTVTALQTLAADPDIWVRSGVAKNPTCPPALLHSLGRDDYLVVRDGAADNPRRPPSGLAQLANDVNPKIVQRVASNPACPPALLRRILNADPSNTDLALCVAANPSADPETLERLVEDHPWAVHKVVAANRSCPRGLLERLVGNNDEDVRQAAAANPSATPALLRRLARSDDHHILAGVAANPSAGTQTLRRLFDDGQYSTDVAYSMAANPACPPKVLAWFLDDPDDERSTTAQGVLAGRSSGSG